MVARYFFQCLICYDFLNLFTYFLFKNLPVKGLNVLCIFHTSVLTYICTTFVFFVRITLVNLHSNLGTSQGKARLKPSLPWAGIPCFSVYLLSRRGNSQVAAIPGSLKLIHMYVQTYETNIPDFKLSYPR